MRRRSLGQGALVGLALAGAGCALEQRVTHLENDSKKRSEVEPRVQKLEESAALGSGLIMKWRGIDLARFEAIERREERMRLELAKLERWQADLEKREAALASRTPAPTPPPGTTNALVVPQVATQAPPRPENAPAPSDGYLHAGATWSGSDRFEGKTVATYFVTGQGSEAFASASDTDVAGNKVTMAPRDPGATGKDGDALVGKALDRTRFLASSGDTVDLDMYKDKKNVVLVVMRGLDPKNGVCIACSGQTLAISQNLDEFAKRDAEVLLLYPGKPETVSIFLDAVRDLGGTQGSLPVEILLDTDLSVVKEFKIEGKLAKPTTVIIDKKGIVRFAHVGRSKTDRPTVPQMLDALDRIVASEQKK